MVGLWVGNTRLRLLVAVGRAEIFYGFLEIVVFSIKGGKLVVKVLTPEHGRDTFVDLSVYLFLSL